MVECRLFEDYVRVPIVFLTHERDQVRIKHDAFMDGRRPRLRV